MTPKEWISTPVHLSIETILDIHFDFCQSIELNLFVY